MKHFEYALHNLIGHPVYEILHLIGLEKAADWVHESTLPASAKTKL